MRRSFITAQLFHQSSLYTNEVGKGIMSGYAAAVCYTSLDTAAAAGLMVLATLGLEKVGG